MRKNSRPQRANPLHGALRMEDEAAGMKQCGGPCLQLLGLDEFDADNSKPDGKKTWCKHCRAEQEEKKKDIQTRESLTKLFDKMDASVLLSMGDEYGGGTNIPHQVQGLEVVIELMGGIRGFAMQYVAHMLATPPGSAMRQKALDKIWQLIMQCSDEGKVSKPRELMSDEELEADLNKRALKLHTINPSDIRESA